MGETGKVEFGRGGSRPSNYACNVLFSTEFTVSTLNSDSSGLNRWTPIVTDNSVTTPAVCNISTHLNLPPPPLKANRRRAHKTRNTGKRSKYKNSRAINFPIDTRTYADFVLPFRARPCVQEWGLRRRPSALITGKHVRPTTIINFAVWLSYRYFVGCGPGGWPLSVRWRCEITAGGRSLGTGSRRFIKNAVDRPNFSRCPVEFLYTIFQFFRNVNVTLLIKLR